LFRITDVTPGTQTSSATGSFITIGPEGFGEDPQVIEAACARSGAYPATAASEGRDYTDMNKKIAKYGVIS